MGSPTSECFSRLKTVNSARNGAPKKEEELYLVLTNVFLQPAKAAAMYTAPRVEACPPPPYPTFFASTKPIFKMDCTN